VTPNTSASRSDGQEPVANFRIVKEFSGFTLDCEATFSSGVTAVFGRSGSGKTTLLNCLAGMVRPDEGHIDIMGRPLYNSGGHNSGRRATHLPPERRRIGYVFQDGMLFPHMSVAANIDYGHALVAPERRTLRPDDVIELLELGPLVGRPVSGLSGGEAQRVALARALAASPQLLLLDEPLSSLDAIMRGVIIRYLKRVWTELRIPMVLVSHSLSEVMALAEDTLVLSAGKKVAQGPPARVLGDPAVGALADYPALENLVEAEIVRPTEGSSSGLVLVGEATLQAPDVYGRTGERVMVSIRASDIIIATGKPTGLSARNVVPARLTELDAVSGRTLAYFDVGARLVAEITDVSVQELGLRPGSDVYLIMKSNSVQVLNPERT
jgi:molybdate transport system ATP-binding protein